MCPGEGLALESNWSKRGVVYIELDLKLDKQEIQSTEVEGENAV